MPRPKPDPELVGAALELLAAGVSFAEAGATLGVTGAAVHRWKRLADAGEIDHRPPGSAVAPSIAPALDHMAPPAPPAPAISIGTDLASDTRALVNDMLRRAVDYEAAGNMTAAQRQRRDAATIMPVLARLEREHREDSDVVRISRAEAKAIDDNLRERIAATLNRPILCAHCSRALSVRWGTEGLAEPDDRDPGAAAKAR